MKIERLIRMANDISDYFNAEPDRNVAIEGVRNHIANAWEPRMRKAILDYLKADGSGLSDLAKAALEKL